MAEAATIADLRRLINQPTNTDPWTDAVLSARIDDWVGDLTALAATIWREKAATFAGLVDVQEGSSSRKLSQLYTQALAMAAGLDAGSTTSVTGRRAATTRPIERM